MYIQRWPCKNILHQYNRHCTGYVRAAKEANSLCTPMAFEKWQRYDTLTHVKAGHFLAPPPLTVIL